MPLESHDLEELRAALAGIDRVERAIVDDAARVVALICTHGVRRDTIESSARASLERVLGSAADWMFEVTVRAEERERRVRFIGVNREHRKDHHIEAEVTLELSGREVTAKSVSEPGEALELRAVASAALEALCLLIDSDLDVRVGGVKRTRSFDADLMVASLYRPGPPPQQFVGAVLIGGDPYRAAAVAVLSALNRHLGNYLHQA
jgi:hypothetical protein